MMQVLKFHKKQNKSTALSGVLRGGRGSFMRRTMTAEKYMLVTPYMIMKILASDRLLKQ